MHIISVIGLVLLPLVSFSAILQTPYFQLASQNQLNVTLSFSQFLGVCLFVTIVVIAAWWFLTRETNVKAKTRRNATKLVM
jgi:protein-S-isoprenylcysteine O-methyltransferase Ste14